MNQSPEIDAVITWVDGDDPNHIAKRSKIVGTLSSKKSNSIASRLASVNEITYCVESILKYAPFIRNIFIVTDEQVPEVARLYPERIKIIDHKEIYRGFEWALPTINIFSIECLLYRVPGLAEHFLYFNDDFFLIKSTKPTDWFRDGMPVLRGRWETPPDKIWHKRLSKFLGIKDGNRAGFRKTQALAAEMVGFSNRYFRCYHTPRALRKSTFEKYFEAHPALLENQIKHTTRHNSQFNPYALAWHLEIKAKTMHMANSIGAMELHNPDRKSESQIERMLSRAERDPEIICANVQNLNLASPAQQEMIFNWLRKVLPRIR